MSALSRGNRPIPTDDFSQSLRERAVRPKTRQLLISDFRGSDQEADLTVPPNCGGYGRVRHFRRTTSAGWPENPLPIDPACKALGLPPADVLEAQVFQNAACNWRCWYCFVPFELLAAKEAYAAWFTADELLALYLDQPTPPMMIDLTGGQPDLTPEWIAWTIEALNARGIGDRIYLWSDDNLSNDYYFRFLSDGQREAIAAHSRYGRVCCFKGFNAQSFAFNTKAAPELFDRQFQIFSRLLAEGLDLYAYTTFTTPSADGIADDMARFVDRLQEISPTLPLRTVPLEIRAFSPAVPRMNESHERAIVLQLLARDEWLTQLQARFSAAELSLPVSDTRLRTSAAP